MEHLKGFGLKITIYTLLRFLILSFFIKSYVGEYFGNISPMTGRP